MASVYFVKSKKKHRAQFMSPLTNKMVSIQLGNLNKTAKNKWSLNLERVEHAVSHDEPVNAQAQAWLNSLPQKHKTALSKHGLYEESSVPKTFAALCAYMIEKGIKDKTSSARHRTRPMFLCRPSNFLKGSTLTETTVQRRLTSQRNILQP